MQKGPEFSIKESRIATEKEAFKLTKKFLKMQDELSKEMDDNKKIAGVSEDILANLNIIVEKMQKDTTEYIEKFASKPDSAPAVTTPAAEGKPEKVKSSKKRHREEVAVVKTEAAADDVEVKSSKKKKKKKSEAE